MPCTRPGCREQGPTGILATTDSQHGPHLCDIMSKALPLMAPDACGGLGDADGIRSATAGQFVHASSAQRQPPVMTAALRSDALRPHALLIRRYVAWLSARTFNHHHAK